MMHDLLFRRFPLIAATSFVVLTVAACAIQLDRHDEDQPPPPETSETKDTLAPKLEACLTVTPDQVATFEYCRRIWAENRRRFFNPPKQKSLPPPKKAAEQGEQTSPPSKDQDQPALGTAAVAAPAKD